MVQSLPVPKYHFASSCLARSMPLQINWFNTKQMFTFGPPSGTVLIWLQGDRLRGLEGFWVTKFSCKIWGCILWTYFLIKLLDSYMNQLINVIPSRVGTFLLDLRCGQGNMGGTSIHLSLYEWIWDTPRDWVYLSFNKDLPFHAAILRGT